jgi:hypothetical protein
MKFAAIHIQDAAYGKRGEINKIGDYENIEEAYRSNPTDFGNRLIVLWKAIPEGMDERALAAQEQEAVAASVVVPAGEGYDAFTLTASEADQEGNLALVVFDGVKTLDEAVTEWNGTNPTITISHDAPDGSIVPEAQNADLNGGADDGWILVVDAEKQAAAIAQDKAAEIAVKYQEMDEDVFNEMKVVFGTSRADSALTEERTWEKWFETPGNFSDKGLVVRVPHGDFNKGDALDTEEKITNYATAALAAVETFGINRQLRIMQFESEREAILNG